MTKPIPTIAMAECLRTAIQEVMEEYPEVTDVTDFGLLVAEALTTSPHLHWLSGNIWADVDPSVEN